MIGDWRKNFVKCKNCKFWKKGSFGPKHIGLDHVCTNPRKKVKKGCVILTDADNGCRLGERSELERT